MTKPVRIRAIEHPHPDLRKLARALLMLVEQEAAEQESTKPDRKAS